MIIVAYASDCIFWSESAGGFRPTKGYNAMERLYFCDGTPLDILRRRSKALKTNQKIKLSAAQDKIAQDQECSNWSELTRRCWAEPLAVPGETPDEYFLESRIGPDLVTLDFQLLFEAIDDAESFDQLDKYSGCGVWMTTELMHRDSLGVEYANVIGMETPQHVGARQVGKVTRSNFPALKTALSLYGENGHLGPLLSTLHSWGLFANGFLTETEWGELDAWMTFFLRPKKVRVEGRYLLNTAPFNDKNTEDWDWKRAFPFALQGGRIAVCNGSDHRGDFRYQVYSADEWSGIESELRAAFPDGPEKTVFSETWLRRRLSMDEWDANPMVS